MQIAIRRKNNIARYPLSTAVLAVLLGAPTAHGDFSFLVNGEPISSLYAPSSIPSTWPNYRLEFYAPIIYTSPDGTTYGVYVFSAQNLGMGPGQVIDTGTDLLSLDVTIKTGGPATFNSTRGALGIDLEQTSGSGASAQYAANIDGTQSDLSDSATVNRDQFLINGKAYAPPFFGDGAGGTFVGIGYAGPWSTDYVNNPIQTVGNTQAVFINSQTTEYLPSGTPAVTQGSSAQIDSQFTVPSQPGTTTSPGSLDNGTIHALEVQESWEPAWGSNPANFTGGVPFADVVIPLGANFTISGNLNGNFPFGAAFITSPAEFARNLTVTLGGGGSRNPLIGHITMNGMNGNYSPITVPIPLAAQATGYLSISGFNPYSDPEIFGLDAVGNGSLQQLIADLQSGLSVSEDPGYAEAPTGPVGAILAAAGDNVELMFPYIYTPNGGPIYFSYDLSNYVSNGDWTFTSITVIPEPASLTLLLAAPALLRRRPRRK